MTITLRVSSEELKGAAPKRVRLLCARVAAHYDVVADKNYIYIRPNGDDELYYERLDKEDFKHVFYNLYTYTENYDYRPRHGEQAFKTLKTMCYDSTVGTASHDFIPFANGAFSLKSRELITDPDRIPLIWKHLDQEYKEDYNCELFEQTLAEIIPNDADREWFLTYMSYSLSPSIEQQVGLILYGDGNNGKTKLYELMVRLYGERATTTRANKLNNDDVMAETRGTTLCCASEIGGSYMNTDQMENMKALVTETEMQAAKKYQNLEKWNNTAKFLFATNNFPGLQSYSKAFMRRWKIIECPTDFTGREDRTLFDRIYDQESSDVLSMLVTKYIDYGKLVVDWKLTRDQWKNESNDVKRFIDDEVDINGGEILTNKLYKRYVLWCKIIDDSEPCDRKYFYQRMRKCGYPSQPKSNEWYFKVGLKENSKVKSGVEGI